MAAAALEPFVCGGLSAMLGSTVIHPADLIKVRQQVSQSKTTGPLQLGRQIIRQEGIPGLYRGLSASLVRQATYGTARIGFHRTISNRLTELNDGKPIPFSQKAAAGLFSGALAVCIGSPFDVALVRMQNDGSLPEAQRRRYRGVLNATVRIAREEGVGKLWRGLAPNVARGAAMNMGMMASFDQAKQVVGSALGKDVNALETSLIASAIAGFNCALLSQPFDLIKSRLMSQRPDPNTGQLPFAGFFDCIRKTWASEGVLAFMKGFPAYYARCAPHAAIILLSNESITRGYRYVFDLSHDKKHDMVTASRFHSAGVMVELHKAEGVLEKDEDDGFFESGDE